MDMGSSIVVGMDSSTVEGMDSSIVEGTGSFVVDHMHLQDIVAASTSR